MKTKLLLLLLALSTFGCGSKLPMYTASGEKIIMVQKEVQLYRKKPFIWPAKGWVAATEEELIFIPLPHSNLFPVYVYGKDSTFIKLDEIDRFQKKQWALVLPFALEVITKDGTRHPFVTVRRNKLMYKIDEARGRE